MLADEIRLKGIDNTKDLPSLRQTNFLIQNMKRKLGKIIQTDENNCYPIDDSVKNLDDQPWLRVQTEGLLLFASDRYSRKISARIINYNYL